MNDKIYIETISNGIDELLNGLDEERSKIIYKAVWAGAKRLQQNTKDAFVRKFGAAANNISKYIKAPFKDGVIAKGDKAYCEVRVSIMKDFRMKFFEKGTNERYIKQKSHSDYKRKRKITNTGKANYRGRINALHFFKEARGNNDEINNAMINSIENSLKKYEKL